MVVARVVAGPRASTARATHALHAEYLCVYLRLEVRIVFDLVLLLGMMVSDSPLDHFVV